MGVKDITVNKKARFNYEIIDTYEAGISLTGPEIKSIRAGDVSINEAFIIIRKGEAFVINMNIKKYDYANYTPKSLDPTRTRKLLLHKQEINRMLKRVTLEQLTLVPYKLYWKDDHVKMEIILGKGKKLHDKRETIKKRDQERNAKKFY
ncbi:SsrA-binding protein SmpB [Mesoplasma lactucae]|uniref:SsrA-binding protein n=1 Tax=Mesoplasma lactucae ATCC 49193 TaxID=81460 RepID=A0A291IRS9_9MOLU|nr:SsrA-binding protein SmpB [Mesoplasma lactucae]ATG97635.1 SsrA-binding protein [Mesoplasma lactucae ATCC 49193]ATZ19905.1 SsrA-binding protein [Mesoplasma lactucae ATCC 49193]MCL8216768.1 SsrA-binding protein [Mesoplasma lactucae ATCC 49193]